MQKILVIDDDRDMRLLLTRYLQKYGYEVLEAVNGKNALEVLEKIRPDIILCDFKLGDSTGSSLLVKIKEKYSDVPVVIITGYGDIRIAVEVIKLGAYDYVTKPLFPDEILLTIRKALEVTATAPATEPAIKLKKDGGRTEQYIFSDSLHFKALLGQIDRVAPTNYSVIIYGETGSGKEAIAQEIHKRSERKLKPFAAIDCGALSKELAGSELFGHEKGAFTGALNQKIGRFENTNGGTIFLDEIANLPYDVQVSLLRVVSERKLRRLGGTRDIEFDARIIIASNESLWDNEKKNNNLKFREDLFHRFNEFSITVPPLRERKEDIRIFASHFLALVNEDLGRTIKGFTPEVLRIFDTYVWYGNLRELKNVVKRAALLTDDDWIDVRSLPFEISNFHKLQFDQPSNEMTPLAPASQADPATVTAPLTLKSAGQNAEYEMILGALKKANFNKTKAAKLLNIDRKTLYNKLEHHQLLK